MEPTTTNDDSSLKVALTNWLHETASDVIISRSVWNPERVNITIDGVMVASIEIRAAADAMAMVMTMRAQATEAQQ